MPILTDVLIDCLSLAEQGINRLAHKYLRAFILNITWSSLLSVHCKTECYMGGLLNKKLKAPDGLVFSTLRRNKVPKAIKMAEWQ